MKTLLIILITLSSLTSYSQIKTQYQVEFRKAKLMIVATTLPALISGGLGMYLLTTNDKATAAIPLVNMTFFFGVSVKAFNNKNKIKRKL